MDFASINWLAVILCVVVDFVVGSIWYHRKVFYNTWSSAQKLPEPDTSGAGMARIWGLTAVAAIVIAVSMAFMVKAIGGAMPGGVSLVNGLSVGFMLWLGFVATTYLTNNLFANRGIKVWAIEVGNWLVVLLLMGAILGLLR